MNTDRNDGISLYFLSINMIKFSKNLSCEQQLQVLKNKLAKGIIKVCFDPRESIMLAELRFSTACLTVGKFLAMVMGPYLECWTVYKQTGRQSLCGRE